LGDIPGYSYYMLTAAVAYILDQTIDNNQNRFGFINAITYG